MVTPKYKKLNIIMFEVFDLIKDRLPLLLVYLNLSNSFMQTGCSEMETTRNFMYKCKHSGKIWENLDF